MPRDAVALLEDMLAEVTYLQEVTAKADLEDLLDDATLRKGIERSLEILGEAAKAVPADVRARHPDLPWSEMARMRDLLIHAYHRVEVAVVWKTAREHAVPLRGPLEAALDAERRREA